MNTSTHWSIALKSATIRINRMDPIRRKLAISTAKSILGVARLPLGVTIRKA